MSDNYDAVYNAVRSRLSFCDIGQAIEVAVNSAGLSFAIETIKNRTLEALSEYDRPSVIFKPRICIDGNMYCALYGKDLMEGVAGFGESVAAAYSDFDKNWYKKLKETP